MLIDYYEDLCPFCEKNLLLTYICNDCNSVFCEDCLKEAVSEELICSECGKSEIEKNKENRFYCKSCKSENIIAVQRKNNICPSCSGTNVSLITEKMENLKERFKSVIISTKKYSDPLSEKVQIISNLRYKLLSLREDTIKINHFPQLEIEILQLIKLFDNIKESVQKKTADFYNDINRDMKYFIWIEKQPPKALTIISTVADALENHTKENLDFIINSLNRIEDRISSINTKLNFMGTVQSWFLKYLPLVQLDVDEKPVFAIKCKLDTGEVEEDSASIINAKSEITEYGSKNGIVLLSDKKIHFIHEKGMFKKQSFLLFSLILDDLQGIREEGTIGKKLVLKFKNGIYKFKLKKEKLAQFKDFIEIARVFERNVIDPESTATLKSVDISIKNFTDSLEEAIYTLIGLDGNRLNLINEECRISSSNHPLNNHTLNQNIVDRRNTNQIFPDQLERGFTLTDRTDRRSEGQNNPSLQVNHNIKFPNMQKWFGNNDEDDNSQANSPYHEDFFNNFRNSRNNRQFHESSINSTYNSSDNRFRNGSSKSLRYNNRDASFWKNNIENNRARYNSKNENYGQFNNRENQLKIDYLIEMYNKRRMLTRSELERIQGPSNENNFQQYPNKRGYDDGYTSYNDDYTSYNDEYAGYDEKIYDGINNHPGYYINERYPHRNLSNRMGMNDWNERNNKFSRNEWNERRGRSDGFKPFNKPLSIDNRYQMENYEWNNDQGRQNNSNSDRAQFAAKRDRRKFGKRNDIRSKNIQNNSNLNLREQRYNQINLQNFQRTNKLGNSVFGRSNSYFKDNNNQNLPDNSIRQGTYDQDYSSQNLHDALNTIRDTKSTFNEPSFTQDSYKTPESPNPDDLNRFHMSDAVKKKILGKEVRETTTQFQNNSKYDNFEFNKHPKRPIVNGLRSIFLDDKTLDPNIPKPPPEFYPQSSETKFKAIDTKNLQSNQYKGFAERLMDLKEEAFRIRKSIEMLNLKHDRGEVSNDYYFEFYDSLQGKLYKIESEINEISKKI